MINVHKQDFMMTPDFTGMGGRGGGVNAPLLNETCALHVTTKLLPKIFALHYNNDRLTLSARFSFACLTVFIILSDVHQVPSVEHSHIHKSFCRNLREDACVMHHGI